MKCPLCGCPGSIALLNSVSCFNEECRNYDKNAFDNADFDAEAKRINGDPYEEVVMFFEGRDTELILWVDYSVVRVVGQPIGKTPRTVIEDLDAEV